MQAADDRPAWSPDGEWIYFVARSEDHPEIWRASVEGDRSEQITHGGGGAPAVSPDGAQIFFGRDGQGLWRVPANGGQQAPLASGIPRVMYRSWVAGREGVYYVDVEESATTEHWVYYRPYSATDSVKVRRLESQPGFRWTIEISPDEKWLFCSHREHETDIMLVENFH